MPGRSKDKKGSGIVTSVKHRIVRTAISVFTLCMLAACLIVASGCGTKTTQSARIGSNDSGTSVLVANATGKDIEAFYLKRADAADYGEALAQDALLADGTLASIAYPSDDDAAYSLKFTSNDGATYELTSLKLASMADATLKLSASGTSCYLEYTDTGSGKAVSVLESEQVAQAAEEAKAKAEKEKSDAQAATKKAEKKAKEAAEEAKAAKEETAKIKEEYDNYVASENDYSSETYTSGGSSSNGGSSSKGKSSSKSNSSSKNNSSSKGNSSSGSGSGSKSSKSGEDNRCIEL